MDIILEAIEYNINQHTLNELHSEIGFPISKRESSLYSNAHRTLNFPEDDDVYLLYETSKYFRKGLAICFSGIYFKGDRKHSLSWKEYIKLTPFNKLHTIYLDGDTIGGCSDIPELYMILDGINSAITQICHEDNYDIHKRVDGIETIEKKISESDNFVSYFFDVFQPILRHICGSYNGKILMKSDSMIMRYIDEQLSILYHLEGQDILLAFDYERDFKMNFVMTHDSFYWKYLGEPYRIKYINIKKLHFKKSLFCKIMQIEYINGSITEDLYLTGIDRGEEFVKWFSFLLSIYAEREKYENMYSPRLAIQNNVSNDIEKIFRNIGFSMEEVEYDVYEDVVYLCDMELNDLFVILYLLEDSPYVIHAEIVDEDEDDDDPIKDEVVDDKENIDEVKFFSDVVEPKNNCSCKEKKSEMMYCVFCGQSIQSDSRYCCFCGKENPYVK